MPLEALFPLLLDLLCKSTLVLACAGGAAWLCRHASAASRHAIWLAAAAALLLLPATRLATPLWSLHQEASSGSPRPGLVVRSQLLAGSAASQDVLAVDETAAHSLVLPSLPAALAGLWLAGGLLLLVRRAWMAVRVKQLVRQSVPVTDDEVLAVMSASVHRAGVKARLRVSSACRVPMALGLWRPMVLLPAEALGWSRARQAAALVHELGHLRRGDCRSRLLWDVLCACYWMNPLMWIAARATRLAQELACDDLVLGSGADAIDYASQLVDVVRSLGADSFSSRHALAMAQPSTLEVRVRSIVDAGRDRGPMSRLAAAGSALMVLALLGLCGVARLSIAAAKDPVPAASGAAGARQVVRIKVRLIEADAAALAIPQMAWVPKEVPAPGKGQMIGSLDSATLTTTVKALLAQRGARLVSSPTILCPAGTTASAEVVREYSFPVKWEQGSKPGLWKPADFDSRQLGCTVTATPVSVDSGSVTFKLAAKTAAFAGFASLDAPGKPLTEVPDPAKFSWEQSEPVIGKGEGVRRVPVFAVSYCNVAGGLRDGLTAVMDCGTPVPEAAVLGEKGPLPAAAKAAGRRLLLFVAFEDEKPEQARDSISITAKSTSYDAKKGVATAVGDVTVDLPQGTLKADKIEYQVKQDKPTALDRAAQIVLPKVKFVGVTPAQAAEALSRLSKEADPAHEGVRISFKGSSQAAISLDLTHVPLTEALRYVTELASLKATATAAAITLSPADAGPLALVGTDDAPPPPAKPGDAKASDAVTRAQNVVLPKVVVQGATVEQALDVLRQQFKAAAPAEPEPRIVVKHSATSPTVQISLDLSTIPLSEALRYVSGLAGLELEVKGGTFLLRPIK